MCRHPTLAACKAIGTMTGAALMLLLAATAPARALDFACVEPSRYKNLQQIFNDDPTAFFAYFNLTRRPLPPPDTCRALLITGSLGPGAAGALLDRLIEGRGWLAVLYLSFDGSDPEQEATMANLVRRFSLKTYEVRGPSYFYFPDFAVRWTPGIGKGGFLATPAEPTPIDAGLTTFLSRRDRSLKLDPKRYACRGGCRVVWSAGVNRLYNGRIDPAAAATTSPADAATERLRTVFAYRLDRGRLPAADDPLLSRPWDRIPTTPPTMAAALRKECDPEITVAEGLESRVAEAFTEAAGRKLSPPAVSAIIPHLNALKRAGARLQQCLAAAHENLRLTAFQNLCPKTCNRDDLIDAIGKSAREMLKDAGTI